MAAWRKGCPPNPQQVCLFTKHLEIDRRACPQIGIQIGSSSYSVRAVVDDHRAVDVLLNRIIADVYPDIAPMLRRDIAITDTAVQLAVLTGPIGPRDPCRFPGYRARKARKSPPRSTCYASHAIAWESPDDATRVLAFVVFERRRVIGVQLFGPLAVLYFPCLTITHTSPERDTFFELLRR
jgi:hypothetical protein